MLNEKEVLEELETLRAKSEKLEEAVMTLSNTVSLLMEQQTRPSRGKQQPKQKKVKSRATELRDKPIEVRNVKIKNVNYTVEIYKNCVKIGDHIRKIYNCKKGKYFVYGPHTIYLEINSLQAL